MISPRDFRVGDVLAAKWTVDRWGIDRIEPSDDDELIVVERKPYTAKAHDDVWTDVSLKVLNPDTEEVRDVSTLDQFSSYAQLNITGHVTVTVTTTYKITGR